MRIGVADAAGGDADHNVGLTDVRSRDLAFFEWFAELDQLNRFHDLKVLGSKQTANTERRTSNAEYEKNMANRVLKR